MVAHCLYIDGVKSFPINKIVFVRAGCLDPHMGPVDAANYTREPSLVAVSYTHLTLPTKRIV